MPEFRERFAHESRIVSRLKLPFREARDAARAGELIVWDEFRVDVQGVLEDELAAVFLVVFLMMLDDEDLQSVTPLGQALGQAWASAHARVLTTRLIENIRRDLAMGRAVLTIFDDNRIETIAATEVTRAITAAETEARRENARKRRDAYDTASAPQEGQLSRRERAPGSKKQADPGRGMEKGEFQGAWTTTGPLDVGDGLTPVWITERDERVCPICAPLDGQPADAWRDGFPFGPPAHPKCRCHLEYQERREAA